jgi:tRNA threonylcarbamoyl adenosine modification protein YeaZ
VVAGVGPGPFTGLRVGLVTAASICDVADLPAYDVCSLDAIALAADRADGPLLVAGDARRREVYWAVYRSGVRDHYPAVGRPAALPAEVIATSTAMAGAGARLYAAELGLPLVAPDYPSVLGLAHAAAARVVAGAPGELLTPLYLRRPDAAIPAPRKPVTR